MPKLAFLLTIATALLGAGFATPAHALQNAWVSGHGKDAAGCGATSNPCATLQYVHDHVIAAGGEIDILDPADSYGPIIIKKSISIINDGVGAAVLRQTGKGQSVITINAGTNDVVDLRGLTLEGLGAALYGLNFNSGNTLNMQNCVIREFQIDWVFASPSTSFALNILDTVISSNASGGIYILPTLTPLVTVSLKRTQLLNNYKRGGFVFDGVVFAGVFRGTIADSVASNNLLGYGIVNGNFLATLEIVGSQAVNGTTGVSVDGKSATIFLGSSTLAGNYTAVGVSNGGIVDTYGNNFVSASGKNSNGDSSWSLMQPTPMH